MTNKEIAIASRRDSSTTTSPEPTKKGEPPAKLRAKYLRPPVVSALWSVNSSRLECGRSDSANEPNLQTDFDCVLCKSTPYEPGTLNSSPYQQAMNYEKQSAAQEPQPYLVPVWNRVKVPRKGKQQDSMDLNPVGESSSSGSLQNWRYSHSGTIPPPRVLQQCSPKQRKKRVVSDFESLAAQHQKSDLAYLVVDLQDHSAEECGTVTGELS